MVAINSGEKEPQPVRPYFDPRISVGNVITILFGVIALTMGWAHFTDRLDDLQAGITDLRCTLAAAGIAQTTQPCTLPAMRSPPKKD